MRPPDGSSCHRKNQLRLWDQHRNQQRGSAKPGVRTPAAPAAAAAPAGAASGLKALYQFLYQPADCLLSHTKLSCICINCCGRCHNSSSSCSRSCWCRSFTEPPANLQAATHLTTQKKLLRTCQPQQSRFEQLLQLFLLVLQLDRLYDLR